MAKKKNSYNSYYKRVHGLDSDSTEEDSNPSQSETESDDSFLRENEEISDKELEAIHEGKVPRKGKAKKVFKKRTKSPRVPNQSPWPESLWTIQFDRITTNIVLYDTEPTIPRTLERIERFIRENP